MRVTTVSARFTPMAENIQANRNRVGWAIPRADGDGDWFVIDTVGFNDKGVLDAMGHFHSESLHSDPIACGGGFRAHGC